MKINATKFYLALFILVLFAQLYLPSFRVNIILQFFVLVIYFFFEKPKISKSFLFEITPLIIIFFIGFIGFFFHNYKYYHFVKDIFHFIKPVLAVLIGYFFFKKINDFNLFIKTIVICGFISSIIHLIVLFSTGNLFTGSLESIREYSRDNFLELFALFFLVFYSKFNNEVLFKNYFLKKIVLILIIISCTLYFSRTMIIISIIMLLSIYKYTYVTKRTINILGVLFFSVFLFYTYLFSIKIERKNSGLDSFLYKIKNAPAEIFTTKINREDHKDLWDHWRGYEVKRALALMQQNQFSYVVGMGQGSLVNLKFFAPLSDDEKGLKYISELHNGYVYVFYKTGSLGLLTLMFFLMSTYSKIYTSQNKNEINKVFLSGIGLTFIFTTLIITGIYNSRDIIMFIFGVLLYFNKKESIRVA